MREKQKTVWNGVAHVFWPESKRVFLLGLGLDPWNVGSGFCRKLKIKNKEDMSYKIYHGIFCITEKSAS